MTETTDKYLGRQEAADYLTEELGLKTSPKTLGKYATVGGGPIYRRFGLRAVYLREDLKIWAESRLSAPRSNTSELGA